MKSIYVFESHGQFKIGVSQNVDVRLRSIKTGNPNVRLIYESKKIANAYKIENMIHSQLGNYRINGEWFSVPEQINIIEIINETVKKFGIREETPKAEENNLEELMARLFAATKREIENLDEENRKISIENEGLKNRLRTFGWSDFDIQMLVKKAEESAVINGATTR